MVGIGVTPPTLRRCDRGCWARRLAACGLVIWPSAASSCSDEDDPAASETLAPIQTTTTTSTTLPTTTTQPRFYEVQRGDTLTEIADAFGLPIPAIMEANGIVDPNAIQAGQILELPLASEIVVTSLPPSPRCPVRRHCLRSRRRLRRLCAMTAFWPTSDHWSVKIPLDTPHPGCRSSPSAGFVVLADADFEVPPSEYEALEYMDWKSGGDTNFAPIASADGELDCRGFWDKGKTDKDALWTSNAERRPVGAALRRRRSAPTSAGCG